MNATISPSVLIAAAILVMLLVVARLAVQRYGHRIGTDDVHFNELPDPEHRHMRYANLQKAYAIASIAVGVLIILLGIWVTLDAWAEQRAALRLAGQRSTGQVAGALGMGIVFVGVGLIAIQSTLRWDRRPDQILAPRLTFRVPFVRKTSTYPKTDFSALAKASGDSEKPRPVAHWYNANPGTLWVMLVAGILIFVCYVALFMMRLPIR